MTDFQKIEIIQKAMDGLMKGVNRITIDIRMLNDAFIYLAELKQKFNKEGDSSA